MFKRLSLLFFFLCYGSLVFAQQKVNLRSEWMIFSDNKYVKTGQSLPDRLKTVYLEIDAGQYQGSNLEITSGDSFYLFVNGKLIRNYKGKAVLSIDSIRNRTGGKFMLAVNADHINDRSLTTNMIKPVSTESLYEDIFRPTSAFRDFVILSGLIIIIFFVVIIRLHPKLASDYFSVAKVFTLREGEEGLSSARITGSSNVLFYIFCSLLVGFYLMIILFHLPAEYTLPLRFKANEFGSIIWQWMKLSSIILAILFVRIVLIYSLSALFGMKGIAGMHFQNWVRLTLLAVSALTLILFVYYISRGQHVDVYVGFLTSLVVLLSGWIIIGFLKLNSKIEHSMFHLFSYICATEIVPLLITIKVLFQ